MVPRPCSDRFEPRRIANDPVGAQRRHPLSQFRVVGERHPALSGSNDLYWVKTEYGHVGPAATANRLAVARCPDCVGCVLEDLEAELSSQFPDRFLLGRLPR